MLQIYAWLAYPDEAGSFALVSILVCALTTGYTSTMIAYDSDVDGDHRKSQNRFYGYLPDDNGLRGRCFTLMTLISMLHNLSRSLGCAMLAATDKNLLLAFVGGELLLYLLYKLARGDFLFWPRIEGAVGVVFSFLVRIAQKIIADFRYEEQARPSVKRSARQGFWSSIFLFSAPHGSASILLQLNASLLVGRLTHHERAIANTQSLPADAFKCAIRSSSVGWLSR